MPLLTYAGLILVPIGGIVFAEQQVFPKLGYKTNWYRLAGLKDNMPEIKTWAISLVFGFGFGFAARLRDMLMKQDWLGSVTAQSATNTDSRVTGMMIDVSNFGSPSTVFGLIERALKTRRNEGEQAFTVMSCDNLPHNGTVTRRAVVGLVQLVEPALAMWNDAYSSFPNGMVGPDRPWHRRPGEASGG